MVRRYVGRYRGTDFKFFYIGYKGSTGRRTSVKKEIIGEFYPALG